MLLHYRRESIFSLQGVYNLQTCLQDVYNIFSVEPLHVFLLGISKHLKEFTVAYWSSADTNTYHTKLLAQQR